MKKFDLIKLVLPLKFMSLGCTTATLRSETLKYMSTPHSLGFLQTLAQQSPKSILSILIIRPYLTLNDFLSVFLWFLQVKKVGKPLKRPALRPTGSRVSNCELIALKMSFPKKKGKVSKKVSKAFFSESLIIYGRDYFQAFISIIRPKSNASSLYIPSRI